MLNSILTIEHGALLVSLQGLTVTDNFHNIFSHVSKNI